MKNDENAQGIRLSQLRSLPSNHNFESLSEWQFLLGKKRKNKKKKKKNN